MPPAAATSSGSPDWAPSRWATPCGRTPWVDETPAVGSSRPAGPPRAAATRPADRRPATRSRRRAPDVPGAGPTGRTGPADQHVEVADEGAARVLLFGEVQQEVLGATLAEDYGVDVMFEHAQLRHLERPIGTGTGGATAIPSA